MKPDSTSRFPYPDDLTSLGSPELLAPAGSADALRAAVNNGADAVYLGVGDLNARRGAENFTLETLEEATRFAHLHGARVYLAANIVVLADEMATAIDLIDRSWAAGVDAVIVQDIGLMRLVSTHLPHVRVHASTQVGAHNRPTLAELATLGATRVTLARETSLDEIGALAVAGRDLGVEVESFVHGALCFCYSGQCLMSSVIGGRSGNRGLCAQPCRMPYELLTEEGSRFDTPGAYLLSPRDLRGLEHLAALVSAGVSALKIEGRLKRPEYVALVTGVYRQALDRAVADPEGFKVTDAEVSVLTEAFSRGFSSAYLTGERGNPMMSYRRPNNRGVRAGRVLDVRAGGDAVVALDIALDSADTIEFWTRNGRFAQEVGPMTVGGKRATAAPAGERVGITVQRPVASGDRVFRVVNAALENAARRTYEGDHALGRIEVDVAVRAVEGQPLQVEITDGANTGSAGGRPVERARTKTITAEEIAAHVGRFGGTPYHARSWNIELQPGVGMGYSDLHALRREAIESYERSALSRWADRRPALPQLALPTRARRERREAPEIVVASHDPGVVRACLNVGAARAIVPHWALDEELLADPRVTVELPRIAHEGELPGLMALAGAAPRAVAGNLGLLRPSADTGATVEAHWGLNAVNPWTVEYLAEAGARFVWLSPELSQRQVAAIAEAAEVPVGIAVYGRQEIMVSEHCVLMAAGECSQRCETCARRQGWHALRDSKGYSFPVMTDPAGRSHIYNSVPLDLSRAVRDVLATEVDAVRLDFTVERAREASRIATAVRNALVAAAAGRQSPAEPVVETVTAGHFYRGVR